MCKTKKYFLSVSVGSIRVCADNKGPGSSKAVRLHRGRLGEPPSSRGVTRTFPRLVRSSNLPVWGRRHMRTKPADMAFKDSKPTAYGDSSPPGGPASWGGDKTANRLRVICQDNAICGIASLGPAGALTAVPQCLSRRRSQSSPVDKWSCPCLLTLCAHPVSRWRHLTSPQHCVKGGCVLPRSS
jgi:hypothetical protein